MRAAGYTIGMPEELTHETPLDASLGGPAPGRGDGSGRSLSEQAYDQLLDKILRGDLPSGTVLQERSLADSLQISRTPIREALGRLENEGVIVRHLGRIIMVREISVQEIMDVLHIRSMLETEAVTLANGHIAIEELERLRGQFELLKNDPEPDPADHWQLDDALHNLIADASGNIVLSEMVRSLRRRTRMFNLKRMPERYGPGREEHLALIDALVRQDVQAARQAMITHLDNTRQSILRKLNRPPAR